MVPSVIDIYVPDFKLWDGGALPKISRRQQIRRSRVHRHCGNAMKCMAARVGGTTEEPSDVADITFLIRNLRVESAKEVLDLVAQYYPANRIPVKTQYLVEGLFEEGKI